jgi:hypothetical protein
MRKLEVVSGLVVGERDILDGQESQRGLDVSIGKRATPLLLKLQWKGFPLAYSKEHGWCYRRPNELTGFDVLARLEMDPVGFQHRRDFCCI